MLRLASSALLLVMCFGRLAYGRGEPRLEVELATGISGSLELRTVAMMSPLLTVSAPISDETGFIAQWGFTVATGEPSDRAFAETFFAIANPLFGCAILLTDGLVFAPALTVPLAQHPRAESRRPASDFAYRGALGMRGAIDAWLWLPDRFALVLPFTWVVWLDPILVESHLKLAFLAPLLPGRENGIAFQMKTRVAAHLGQGFWLAAGLSGVFLTENAGDEFQAALSPELRYVVGPGSHLGLTLMMNIDGPYGPFSEPGRYWGVIVGGSAQL